MVVATSLDPRHAYVRYYLTVVTQLDEVHAALDRTLAEVRAAVASFADVLAVGDDPDVAAAREPVRRLHTAALWRPQDPALLTGLTDVYEVVGRFSFQGEDDENLQRLAAVVRAAAEEVDRQRRCVTALGRLPERATRQAEGLSQQEIAAAEAARAARLAPFDPVAAQLRDQCARVEEAVRAIPRPDLLELGTADAQYQDYVKRVQSLYQKALPFLRRGLEQLCAVAAVEVPPSWPEVLPFAAALPAELLASPPDETPAVTALRAQSAGLDAAERELQRSADEAGVSRRRIDAEKAALAEREASLMAEALAAKNVVRWASRLEEVLAAQRALEGHHQQRQSRLALLAQLFSQLKQLQSQCTALAAEISQREDEAAAGSELLAKERASPPALFGKDEWRRRVADLEEAAEERQATLAQRRAALARASADLSAVQGRAQAEQGEIAAVERAIAELKERESVARKEAAEVELLLGPHRPAHAVTLAQADDALARVWAARNEARAQIDQLGSRARHLQEELERGEARLKQLPREREALREALAEAERAGVAAREGQLRALAEQRRASFEQHAAQVLAPLEESLAQVDRIFIEPARQVLLQRAEGTAYKSGSLRAQAEGLAHAVAQLAPRVEPLLAQQAEALRRVQAEFVEKVGDAVRAAWG